MNLPPCKFTFDDDRVFEGFSHGSTWNGWDNVSVTPAVRDEIVAHFRATWPGDDDDNGNNDMLALEPDERGLICLGWCYTTTIVEPIYVVRDRASQGVDFLLWGPDLTNAVVSLVHCVLDGIDAELVTGHVHPVQGGVVH